MILDKMKELKLLNKILIVDTEHQYLSEYSLKKIQYHMIITKEESLLLVNQILI